MSITHGSKIEKQNPAKTYSSIVVYQRMSDFLGCCYTQPWFSSEHLKILGPSIRKRWPLCTQRWWPEGQCPLCLGHPIVGIAVELWPSSTVITVNLVAPVCILCCKSRIRRPAIHWLASSHSQRQRTGCLTSLSDVKPGSVPCPNAASCWILVFLKRANFFQRSNSVSCNRVFEF